MVIFCISLLPLHPVDYECPLYYWIPFNILNRIKLETQFKKTLNQFRQFILMILFLYKDYSYQNLYQLEFHHRNRYLFPRAHNYLILFA